MKTLAFAFLAIFFTSQPSWQTDFNRAQQEAKQSHKFILLNFSGSDWCAPCIKMKREVFEQETFIQYANDNLVLVRADFPRLKKNQLDANQKAHNEKLAEQYNSSGKFPLTLLLNEDGKVVKTWDGYSNESPQEFIKQIDQSRNGK
ncbi:thioredoxin family protein [Chryseolinea sp. H1M3-3]|uniref:thioredoxin family protein n=1 Tax=Chryseolinea sp. H1M3-3 TaxID=3034144 RepID=UPI0023EBBA1C|nr:thioredoxin family protein [Chryseolinea sp. H1M3-3]